MYNVFKKDRNMTYSVDMLRLKTYITKEDFRLIEFRLHTFWKEHLKKEYKSLSLKQFMFNYVIEIDDENSFWIGFLPNSERNSLWNDNTKHNFTIEFNPNKIKNNVILLKLLKISSDWYIKSFDLAIDVKINILDLIIHNSGRIERKTFERGLDDKTIILGKGDGRLKVYNKKKESDLKIKNLTRIEISRVLDDFSIRDIWKFSFGDFFPDVYVNEYIYSLSDYQDKTLLAILYAVQNGFPVKDLTRRYQEKINCLMTGGYQIEFSEDVASDVVEDTIKYYFNYLR